MDVLRLLLRAKRWAQHPPSWRQVQLFAVIAAICAVIFMLDRWGFWPDALRVERLRP